MGHVTAVAWRFLAAVGDDPGIPASTQYGVAGLVFTVLLIAASAVYRDGRRREDRLAAALDAKDGELKALNHYVATEVVATLTRATDATAQMARLFDRQVDDLRRRERGPVGGP